MQTNSTKQAVKRTKQRMSWNEEQTKKNKKQSRFIDKRQAIELQE